MTLEFCDAAEREIALLPMAPPGPGGNFAAATGLDQKWDLLTEQQLVDTNQFNAARYPLAFHLSTLQGFSSASTNRSVWFTNAVSGTSTRFYRLKTGP